MWTHDQKIYPSDCTSEDHLLKTLIPEYQSWLLVRCTNFLRTSHIIKPPIIKPGKRLDIISISSLFLSSYLVTALTQISSYLVGLFLAWPPIQCLRLLTHNQPITLPSHTHWPTCVVPLVSLKFHRTSVSRKPVLFHLACKYQWPFSSSFTYSWNQGTGNLLHTSHVSAQGHLISTARPV